jgi:hypothetical protein
VEYLYLLIKTLSLEVKYIYMDIIYFLESYYTKAPFGYIEFLKNQFLKTDGLSNGTVFASVFRN